MPRDSSSGRNIGSMNELGHGLMIQDNRKLLSFPVRSLHRCKNRQFLKQWRTIPLRMSLMGREAEAHPMQESHLRTSLLHGDYVTARGRTTILARAKP